MNESGREMLAIAGGLLAVDATTREVSGGLTRAGVLHIVLKGPPLSQWLFREEGTHASVDVDIIVNPEQRVVAERVLAELGFEPLLLDVIPGDRPNHARPYWRSTGPIEVDLHKTLLGANASPELVWAALQETSTLEDGLPVPGQPARLAHLALHAAQNGVHDARTLAYLHRALDTHPESSWRAGLAFAEAIDAREAFALGLSLTPKGRRRLVSLGLTEPLTVAASLRAGSAPNTAHAIGWLVSRTSVRERLRFVLWKMFPPPRFMRSWSPLARSGFLGLVASYPLRTIWLAARTPAALKHWARARRASSRAGVTRSRERENGDV